MISLFRTRRILLLAVMALLLPLAVACSAGDDDEDDADPTATTEAPSGATTPDVETTPTSDTETESTPDADMTGTPDADTTGTPDDAGTPDADMTGTPDADMTGTPDSDAMETPDADMTGTPDTDIAGTPDAEGTPDSTGGVGGPLTDIGELQEEVPNFTLEFTGNFENVPDPQTGSNVSASLDTMLEQSEANVYHMTFTSEGQETVDVEIWSLGDSAFVAESGGAPVELPGGIGDQFSPSSVLVVVPPIESLDMAEEVGQEDVDGRSATHYRLDSEQAAMVLAGQGVTVTDAAGEMDIWVDDELGFVLQMMADNVTWTNEDGSEASVTVDYMVSAIGETPDVEAPSS